MMTAAPARQQRRTDLTKARLLDAAVKVFCERGYDDASLSEITARADLGTGTLYLHFRDKRSVYEALVRREGLVVRQRWLDRPRRQTRPPGGRRLGGSIPLSGRHRVLGGARSRSFCGSFRSTVPPRNLVRRGHRPRDRARLGRARGGGRSGPSRHRRPARGPSVSAHARSAPLERAAHRHGAPICARRASPPTRKVTRREAHLEAPDRRDTGRMERNIFTEEHALFRKNVRAWVEKEIVPYKDVWEEANIVPRELWKSGGCAGLPLLLARGGVWRPRGGLSVLGHRHRGAGARPRERRRFQPALRRGRAVPPFLRHRSAEAAAISPAARAATSSPPSP